MDTATTATPLNVCESDPYDTKIPHEDAFVLPPAHDSKTGVRDVVVPHERESPEDESDGVDKSPVEGGDEPRMSDVVKRLLKTRFCRYGVHCKYGAKCFYAHSPDELRQRPPPPAGYRRQFPQAHAAPFPPEHMAAVMSSQDPLMGYPSPLGFLPEAMAQFMPPLGDMRNHMMPYSAPEQAVDNAAYAPYGSPPSAMLTGGTVPPTAYGNSRQANAPVVNTSHEQAVHAGHSGLTPAQIANLLRVAAVTKKESD
ncbi:hypothetical protein FOL47_001796 [Perkinsus chesapeaki]|uniref:C3H1-type domain-containing protein n=1 Tax=Perkinsus chesapeaki TaxID=330153 RepID=A0A7J6MIM8_PERCH|nr:hypothetical protein FOL47_001796 [Perkinsus chesapeaki]